MAIVPPTAIYKRSDQLPHCIQLHHLARGSIIVQQDALEQAAQAYRVRCTCHIRTIITQRDTTLGSRGSAQPSASADIDFDIMRANFLVPEETRLTIIAKTWIPFTDTILEIFPECNFFLP